MLYQLRAALDSTIYGAAIRDSGQDPPPNAKYLEFPICDTPHQFKSAARKIAPLSDERRELVELVQPYMAQRLATDTHWVTDSLALLNDWARKDRHRKLHVVGSWASNANPKLRLPEGTSLKWLLVAGNGFLEDMDQVAEFAIEGWEPGMNIEANSDLFIDIAVNEVPPPADDSDTLGRRCAQMCAAVKALIGTIEGSYGVDFQELKKRLAQGHDAHEASE